MHKKYTKIYERYKTNAKKYTHIRKTQRHGYVVHARVFSICIPITPGADAGRSGAIPASWNLLKMFYDANLTASFPKSYLFSPFSHSMSVSEKKAKTRNIKKHLQCKVQCKVTIMIRAITLYHVANAQCMDTGTVTRIAKNGD